MFTIDLDADYKATRFLAEPVITNAETVSYATAQRRMQEDPQFMLMDRIAQQLRRRIPKALMDEALPSWVRRGARSEGHEKAMEMVATFMILANNCGANYFERTGLPFAFRNFDEKTNLEYAQYSTEPGRHEALEKEGLWGRYSHLTSPIRRAPDS